MYTWLRINVLFVRKFIRSLKQPFVEFFFPLQTATVAYFQRKTRIIRVFCTSGRLAVPINPGKSSSTVRVTSVRLASAGWSNRNN